jgi:hypothetical protein
MFLHMNDAAMDLMTITAARSDEDLYEALRTLRRQYYLRADRRGAWRLNTGVSVKAMEMTDTGPVVSQSGSVWCCAICDIPHGRELFRGYGWTAWLCEIAHSGILTTENVLGFLQYLG